MLQGFPAISDHFIKTLILGSMPGKDSLRFGQYYAHPRNAFWPIMVKIFSAEEDISYSNRLTLLLQNNIGLWDVIKSCTRETSLDSAIIEETIVVNDFKDFLAKHPHISRIYFNGMKAEQSFKRYAAKVIESRNFDFQRLPSTSPANARMTFQQKYNFWSKALLSSC